jgi:hypothetical protein
MNLTMPQPVAYPFYMGSPRLPFSVPWSPNPFQYSTPSYQTAYPLPFILSHQPQANFPPKTIPSYTNTRYNHLKQSTSHINRHRSIDTSLHSQHYTIPNYQYRPLKTKSVSDFQQLSHQNATHLLKAHSWHSMNHLHQPNINVNHTKEIQLNHENHSHHHHHRPRSPKRKKKSHQNRSLSPKEKQLPEQGIVRISTFDQMPLIHNPIYKENLSHHSNNNSKPKKSTRMNSTKQSSSSSTISSQSSFQKRVNGSLRNDPLLIAAMEDFRQLHRASSQSTSLTYVFLFIDSLKFYCICSPHQRDLSRDSLCSNSTHHSSSSISRSHSQSSFTSLERLEIRHLIKTLKSKGFQTLNIPFQSTPIPPPSSESCSIKKPSSLSIIKPKKSSVTEELDREFTKLRSNNPHEELNQVKPSLIHKPKKSHPSLRLFDELLHQVPMQTFKQTDENSIISIPVPRSSPIPSSDNLSNEKMTQEIKPDYAIPIKRLPEVNLRPTKKDEQIRSFSFCKPINDILNETRPARPSSMFNWLQCGLTNPFPKSCQSNFNLNNHEHEYDKSLVKENIYASDIDVHIPLSNEKDYLNNQTQMKDYLSDYKEQSTTNSSIINDFSRLFKRSTHHKHEEKSKLKTKFHKNNHHLRCSIM